jgi:TonB family protein
MGDFLKANIQYPIAARQAGVKGKVIITAIMDPDGNLIDPEVLKDIGYGCGAEAVRLCIAMPKWTPGKRDGQAVNCRVRIPVVFSPHQ